MIYLLNTPILTAYGLWRFEGPLALHDVRARLADEAYTSAIGHAATAVWLSRLLGRDIPANRIEVGMQPGDAALVLRILQRLPEGQLLDAQALERIPFELGWLVRLE